MWLPNHLFRNVYGASTYSRTAKRNRKYEEKTMSLERENEPEPQMGQRTPPGRRDRGVCIHKFFALYSAHCCLAPILKFRPHLHVQQCAGVAQVVHSFGIQPNKRES